MSSVVESINVDVFLYGISYVELSDAFGCFGAECIGIYQDNSRYFPAFILEYHEWESGIFRSYSMSHLDLLLHFY